MVDRASVQYPLKRNEITLANPPFGATNLCGVPDNLANLSEPLVEEKAPASAGIRAEAETKSFAASGDELDSLNRFRMQFVIAAASVRPELASMVAALVFGRAAQ